MRTKEELKQAICEAVDRRRGEIEKIGDQIMENPELGFKEFKTAKLVADTVRSFDIPPETGLAITGVKGVIRGKNPGPTVALMGEMDSLLVSDHPHADSGTGAAHACGHNAQIAGLMGAMMGLVDSGAMDELCGNIVIFAVPAEEYVEIEYRLGLKREGKLSFLGGKPELIQKGHFNDVDLAAMIHTHGSPELKKAAVLKSCNGCIVKLIRYRGLAAHAGSSPHKGINALNAAHLALAAIHTQRETFKDEDAIRVHPIITRGGELVNVVPADVRLETFVRGRTNEAIMNANTKVDRALRAGAMAIGARVEINTLPGYMPLQDDHDMQTLFMQNAQMLFGAEECTEAGHRTGSTDMGDISHIMPAVHPSMSGASGISHGHDFLISDREMAYMAPAKALALMAVDLLYGNAEKAKEIKARHRPIMSKKEYLSYQNRVFQKEIFDGETGTSKKIDV
ncbi:N-acyl-L-amino acid amidohydrolase (EC [Olavius sp. associated proteobacterium Delta 1]|nr:N-acyl-L-amino acid amidohydrolase (EC [Olavius sp. associated proteobacterium Delta 1]